MHSEVFFSVWARRHPLQAMSLRPSMKNGAEYNRYEHLYDMLQNELQVKNNVVIPHCRHG